MQRTAFVTALVAAVVFAVAGWFVGSQSPKVTILKHSHLSKNCKARDCDVTIKFDCVNPANPTPSTCEPYAEHEVILVTANHKIEFNIDPTMNFTFNGTDGIKFTTAAADGSDPSRYFPCQAQGPKKYKCDIASGTPPDTYKYRIRVQNFADVDPWVVNN